MISLTWLFSPSALALFTPSLMAARMPSRCLDRLGDLDERCGASLREVGQVLRHAGTQNTAGYAKVDHAALSALARPWPAGAR